MSRLNIKADSSFNDLHGALEKAVNISDSAADYLLFASVPKVLKQWESTPATPATPATPVSGIQRTAILLGKRIVSPHPQNTSLLVQTVEVSGMVQLETPLCADDLSETGAEVLTEINQWLLRKTLAVGEVADLVVVGCFVHNDGDGPVRKPATGNNAQRRPNLARKMLGLRKATLPSVSTKTLSSTSPEDIRTCLRLREAVATCMSEEEAFKSSNSTDPFILLKRVLKKGRGAEDEVCLETFHLSDQALLLHAQGLIHRPSSTGTSKSTKNNGESLSAQSWVSKLPRRTATSGAADALSSATMDLLGPVLLPNFVESKQVDSQLLVVPIAVRPSATGKIVADGVVAKGAKKYLRKLLRRVLSLKGRRDEETLSRLRDINLLLYLSILLDEPVFGLL
eukprot:gene16990-19362_t